MSILLKIFYSMATEQSPIRQGDNLFRLPTRAIVVAYSKNVLGRTFEESRNMFYNRGSPNDKIMHLTASCSGMNDPQVHYVPAELVHMFRWCGNCAGYGDRVELPSYCACCDNIVAGRTDTVDMIQFNRHANTQAAIDPLLPIDADDPCDQKYQRTVLREARAYHEKQNALARVRQAGNAPFEWARLMFARTRRWPTVF